MAVDKQFMMQRGDKEYVLYAGLLNEAHERGLQTISTEIRQIPSADNGNVAIVHAMVVMQDEKRFAGIGDASPESVGRMIVPHILRMAETRAKARALRDATNIGVTAFEELGPDEDSAPAPVTPLREAQQQAKPQYQPQGEGPKPASEKQLNYLKALLKNHGDDARERLESKLKGKSIEEMNSTEARKWIEKLAGKTG